jgi:hypothetical protein
VLALARDWCHRRGFVRRRHGLDSVVWTQSFRLVC